MMSKTTSARTALRKQLLVFPLLTFAIFLFSSRSFAQQTGSKTTTPQHTVTPAIPPGKGITDAELKSFQIIAARLYSPGNEKSQHKKLAQTEVNKLESYYKRMNKTQQANAPVRFMGPIPPLEKASPTTAQLAQWKDSKMYGVWIDGKRISNTELDQYTAQDFDQWSASRLSKTSKNYGKHYFQIDLMTKSYYQAYYENAVKNEKTYMVFRNDKLKSKD